jgi:hypothetical protein
MPGVHQPLMTRKTRTIWLVVLILLVFPVIVAVTSYGAYEPLLAFFGKHTTSQTGLRANGAKSGTRQMTFSEHSNYMNLSHEYDSLWMDLLPPNGGFILKTGKHGVRRRYGISMFHQLHCLGMMREAFQDLKTRLVAAEMSGAGHGAQGRGLHSGHGPSDDADHWLHCFDYLRQVSVFMP